MWKALTTTALLGLDRSDLPEELRQALLAQGISPNTVPEKMLLDGAAILRKQSHNHAAFPISDTLPISADLSAERPCSAAIEKALEAILEGSFAPALPEFLQLAAANQLHVPAAYLPLLLDLALRDVSIHILLQPVAGPRADWLISLNPVWSAPRIAKKTHPVERMSDADFNAAGLAYIAQHRDLESGQPAVKLLSTPGYVWSNELVAALIANFSQWLERHSVVYAWHTLHYRAMLEAAAYGCHAATCKAFDIEWTSGALEAGHFRRIIAFREEMAELFSKQ